MQNFKRGGSKEVIFHREKYRLIVKKSSYTYILKERATIGLPWREGALKIS